MQKNYFFYIKIILVYTLIFRDNRFVSFYDDICKTDKFEAYYKERNTFF